MSEEKQPDWESKDIYLSKEGEEGFIGLHAVGEHDQNGVWHNMEAWGNAYDKNKKFQASIFRIFGPIEETSEDLQQDGWKVVANWKE